MSHQDRAWSRVINSRWPLHQNQGKDGLPLLFSKATDTPHPIVPITALISSHNPPTIAHYVWTARDKNCTPWTIKKVFFEGRSFMSIDKHILSLWHPNQSYCDTSFFYVSLYRSCKKWILGVITIHKKALNCAVNKNVKMLQETKRKKCMQRTLSLDGIMMYVSGWIYLVTLGFSWYRLLLRLQH